MKTSLAPELTELQKKTAQAIVNIFETGTPEGSYSKVTLLVGDPGHLTYGRSQTTLASGNLYLLIKAYCESAAALEAASLQPYLDRLAIRDYTLDDDASFRRILRDAGEDPVMHTTQDRFFDRVYWAPSLASARNEGLYSGLATAITYDSRIHGSWGLIRDKTNTTFGSVKKLGEKSWSARYVEVRREWLANHPNRLLRKTVYRMETFGRLVQEEKWNLDLPLGVRGVVIHRESLMGEPTRVSAESGQERLIRLQTPYLIGDDVRAIQEALNVSGISGPTDGIYGPMTEARVRQFQVRQGLKPDGLVGPATRAALGL